MIVMKFGGTSVQDAAAIRRLVDVVKTRSGGRLVVVSAMAKVTDSLLEIARRCERGAGSEAHQVADHLRTRHLQTAHELGLSQTHIAPIEKWFDQLANLISALVSLREVSPRSRDMIASFGELCSSILVKGAIEVDGTPSAWVDSREMILTDSQFQSAQVNWELTTNQVNAKLPTILHGQIAVTQGFIGSDPNGQTTTLGRGGSDYSAAIYGACLGADRVEIWTDVCGILSTDPRLVASAQPIRQINYLEASEMAYFGAKVLHPSTIYPAVKKKIPVCILNSKLPEDPGTEITYDTPHGSGVRGIAFKNNVTMVNIHSSRMLGAHGFLKSVFDVFAHYQLSVDLISTSEVSVSLTFDPNSNIKVLGQACEELKALGDVEMTGGQATISVIGGGIRTTPGIAAKIFGEVKDINVQMISMGASELNLSFVVAESQASEVIKRLHRVLIESN